MNHIHGKEEALMGLTKEIHPQAALRREVYDTGVNPVGILWELVVSPQQASPQLRPGQKPCGVAEVPPAKQRRRRDAKPIVRRQHARSRGVAACPINDCLAWIVRLPIRDQLYTQLKLTAKKGRSPGLGENLTGVYPSTEQMQIYGSIPLHTVYFSFKTIVRSEPSGANYTEIPWLRIQGVSRGSGGVLLA